MMLNDMYKVCSFQLYMKVRKRYMGADWPHAGNLERKPRNRERSEIDMSKPNWREETCL
jgi:hypothetical protein